MRAARTHHEAGPELPDTIERGAGEPGSSLWPTDGDAQRSATAMAVSLIHPAQAGDGNHDLE